MTDTHLSDPVRTLDGHLVPAPGVWRIDPGHADLAFTGRHLLVTKVRGRFTRIDGAVRVAPQMTDSSVHVTIDMASVESGNSVRDTHIRSAELFDVERYPTATFASNHVSWHGNRGTVTGDLTIHGVTRSVPLEVTFEGHVTDPWGAERAVFSARTTLNREDFDITWNVALESGGLLVSREIQIEINLETVLGGD